MGSAGEDDTETLYCKTLQSVFVENRGKGTFRIRPLPLKMQTAPVYGVLAEDVNSDGHLDFIAVGNSYAPDVVSGRCDAFIGQVMIGNGAGNFTPMHVSETGFFVQGDAKGIVRLETRGKQTILVSQNDDSLEVFTSVEAGDAKYVRPEAHEVTALMSFENGKERRIEVGYGSSYLSQSSRSIAISPQTTKLILFDVKGMPTRTITY